MVEISSYHSPPRSLPGILPAMLFALFKPYGLLPSLLSSALLASVAKTYDPCAKIGGLTFVDPADAIACQRSIPFNETVRQNVMSVVSRVFDFYTFEDFYLESGPPFPETSTNIRKHLKLFNEKKYATDYDFNLDLWAFTTQLNDGHTRWYPNCYLTYQNILPAPIVLLDKGVFIAPDSVQFLRQLGKDFINYLEAKNFDWKRFAGAKVLEIDGFPALNYIDKIARTESGNFLDHNVRVNSVVSGYRLAQTSFSQRLGDLAGPIFLTRTSLDIVLIPRNSTTSQRVVFPYVASLTGTNFTNKATYYSNNCAPTNETNGVDLRSSASGSSQRRPILARAARLDPATKPRTALGLPRPYLPTLNPTNGSSGVIKSFVLPGNKTGVMFVGSFDGNFTQFPNDVVAAINDLQASGVTNLLIDVTNNGGGFVCLGLYLHQYLAGSNFGTSAFESTSRANPLAQRILRADIRQNLNSTNSFYTGDNWQFVNGSKMSQTDDYNDPSVLYIINNRNEPTSQRFEDLCPLANVTLPESPPFDLSNVAIVGNGNCASTCALFTTLMYELHNTTMVVFGGHPDLPIEFKGMAGNQVLEWAELDSEIKTAGLKQDPLAPPDLIVNANMRHNWRTAYSYFDKNTPIAYRSEQPQYRFPYTEKTYNNPQNVWLFTEKKLFGNQ
ncbi:hypothetical protein F5148DRAFT_5147 [Russula earlei]|uniref:Uncharacterized protein n=1 Tax=Russula earlei TaxID=71964 RepID=A0ACC0UQ53_9AGAM|nr:hypothetical protein F5148DRAFT_5147 [Russula earlei]